MFKKIVVKTKSGLTSLYLNAALALTCVQPTDFCTEASRYGVLGNMAYLD
jgi:hypothetical protein